MSFSETPSIAFSTLSAPELSKSFQKAEVIPNKVDKDGHHYLKVLLLSNKKTKNNWIAPYKNIGELPKAVLDSFLNVPTVSKHDHEFYDSLDETMKNSGLDTEERYQELLKKCNEIKDGYVDWLFLDNPNSTTLYGQKKVTDPQENKYIEEHGVPSKVYTSPALSGTYDIMEDGTKVYHLDTIRAFHVAGVPVPAFDESEAMVKGVCKNGNSESCRDYLMYAGIDTVQDQAPNPMENVNNKCSCNSNIDMSSNTKEVPNEAPSSGPLLKETFPSGAQVQYQNSTDTGKSTYTIEQSVSDKPSNKPQETVVERNSAQEVLKSQKQIDEDREKEKLIADNNLLKQKVMEQKNFFLDEMLTAYIPKQNYANDEEYATEKGTFKTFINKYEVSLEDAKWLITKSVKPVQTAPQPEPEETEGKKSKKSGELKQYAGWEPPVSSNMYQSDFITKPPTRSGTEIINKKKDDDDWKIEF
jgi:hypothetical protein